MKITDQDIFELERLVHEDQGSISNRRFTPEFAYEIFSWAHNVRDSRMNLRSYTDTLWLEPEQNEPAPAVRLEPAAPPHDISDDVPF